jgi:DNA-binding transcriptional ArsR family regulator
MMSTQSPTISSDSVRSVDEPANHGMDRLPSDQLFHLLANQRRRRVLYYLREHEETVSLRELAEQIAAWEHGISVRTLGSNERQRVYISLYQNHLPKLDDNGVIDYNQSRGTIERTTVANQFDPYIEAPPYVAEHDGQPAETDTTQRSRSNLARIVGLCGVGLGVLTTGWLGVVSTPLLLVLTWVGICIAAVFDSVVDVFDRLKASVASKR